MKVRKKPIEVHAWPVSGLIEIASTDWESLPEPVIAQYNDGNIFFNPDTIDVCTLEGWHRAGPHDYVICGVNGELYPIKPDIFEKTYEVIAE